MSREDDFLARWSRRKLTEPPPEAAVEPEPAQPAPAPEKTEAEVLEELGLPDPDTLEEGADIKAFMAKAVPDYLRRRALRRLWAVNPALANLDGLIDYGDDFTDSATVIENLQTAWAVGRGYAKKATESLAEGTADGALDDEAPDEGGDVGEGAATAGDAAPASSVRLDGEAAPGAPEPEADATLELAEGPREPDHPVDQAAEAPLPPRRRMRFVFD